MLLGDTKRGKTTFSKYILVGELCDTCTTLGVEVHGLYIEHNGNEVCINMWDTGGDERFKGLDDKYYVKADGAIIFYSNEDEKNKYIRKFKNVVPDGKIVLVHSYVGENKPDLPKEKEYLRCVLNMENENINESGMFHPIALMLTQMTPAVHHNKFNSHL